MPITPHWVTIGTVPQDRLIPFNPAPPISSGQMEISGPPSEIQPIRKEILTALAFFSQHESLQIYARVKALSLLQPGEATGQILLHAYEDGQHLQTLGSAVARLTDPAIGSQLFEITARNLVETTQALPLLFTTEVLLESLHLDILNHVLKPSKIEWLRELFNPIIMQEGKHVQIGLERAKDYIGAGLLTDADLLSYLEPRGSFLLTASGVEEETKHSLITIMMGERPGNSSAISLLKPLYQEIQENQLNRMIQAGISEEKARNFMDSLRLIGPGLC